MITRRPNAFPTAIPAFFFFVSGFCSLLYQIVWMRLAFASFGINTPVMSVVLSVFMAGLALGSWWGGRFVAKRSFKTSSGFLSLYALSEGFIALGALAVPWLFSLGETFLLPLGSADSIRYLFFSAVALFLSLLPWCWFMGTTFPFMMAFLQKSARRNDDFSFLYTANVLGAMAGTLATLFLVETLGFHGALWTAAALNAAVALSALALAQWTPSGSSLPRASLRSFSRKNLGESNRLFLPVLFTTGFTSMALEVVWTRDFTVVLGNQVYSFASLLFTYLLSTFFGSGLYRLSRAKNTGPSLPFLLGLAFPAALLTLLLNDWRIHHSPLGVLLSIVPFCLALGYLTPGLVDRFSNGDPSTAAAAYAVNVLGCILGPLAASYLLLPYLGVKWAMILLSLPFLFFLILNLSQIRWKNRPALSGGVLGILLLFPGIFWSTDYEERFGFVDPTTVLRRDYAATVVSRGNKLSKYLYVNGIGMTYLGEATKMMAHLPLAALSHPPKSALDICFGMGTTFRSLASWNIQVTAVELVPSVPKAFGFYHSDAQKILANPNCRVVVDDGGRFLHRTQDNYDVITIDPPPPLEAAGSSLLYSTEFYGLVKSHLKEGGVLQQWAPMGDYSTIQAVARSITQAFPYVRVYAGRNAGFHFLASLSPIPPLQAAQMLQKMPPAARQDLAEWARAGSPKDMLQEVLSSEVVLSSLLNKNPRVVITHDLPYNEYYLLRRWKAKEAS